MSLLLGLNLTQQDIVFLLTQLRLPGNIPLLPIDPTGIRDVKGIGNNINNPTWGAADQLFTRDTYNAFTFTRTLAQAAAQQAATGAVNFPLWTQTNAAGVVLRGWGNQGAVNWSRTTGTTSIGGGFSLVPPVLGAVRGSQPVINPGNVIDYSIRGINIYDARPRIISNLVNNQTGLTPLQVLDDPTLTPGGRLNPLTGFVNPLPNSSFFGFFGQFFDHGLDFVKKGADGTVYIPLLPSDVLYAPGSANYMTRPRTNTVAGSGGESVNTVSPFVDLSQDYGSVADHTVYLREYIVLANGTPVATGNLVSKAGTSSAPYANANIAPPTELTPLGDLATWVDIKANALKLGLTLHDYNVNNIPRVWLNADNTPNLVAGRAAFIAVNAAGIQVRVQDTDRTALAAAGLTLLTTGHAFLDDQAPFALAPEAGAPGTPPGLPTLTAAGDNPLGYDAGMTSFFALNGFGTFQPLGNHFIAGDGRANENIGLTTIHDIFHKEHNRNVAKLVSDFGFIYNAATGTYTGSNGLGVTTTWTGEEMFQQAKLITEATYQHLVFAEFARKLSPNINAFAGYDITIDSRISSEFANAIYRLGHSMMTDSVEQLLVAPNGIPTATKANVPLLQAFLAPLAYTSTTAQQVMAGTSKAVGNAIDEWVNDTLRNTLVGAKLDLAALNIVAGRDSGQPSWNDVRASLYAQTGSPDLAPYTSWDEVGLNLLHPADTLKDLIMAYAPEAILNTYGRTLTVGAVQPYLTYTLANWQTLQLADTKATATAPAVTAYRDALSAAADLAMNDPLFMLGGNQDFWNIDLWVGGLAEAKVINGQLGSTFDAIFATQLLNLQNGDRFYYLDRLAGSNILLEIDAQTFADVVMRNTGVRHLYSDIFSAPDSTVEMGSFPAPPTFTSLTALRAANQAGFYAGTFYGNQGTYTDARGVASPNGVGNASEVIGGTDLANRINAGGGNDTVWADGGNDSVEGGLGNDFLHGGLGNDLITDVDGDDLIWGNEGNDRIQAGGGIDLVFGGDGIDTIFGGFGDDDLNGQAGDDLIYGDNGAVDALGNLDPTGGADVIEGGDGNDRIYGGGGVDVINGGAGNDTIDGGMGNNLVNGDDGNDLFANDPSQIGYNSVFLGGFGFDTVDYSRSIGVGPGAGATRIGVTVDLDNLGAAAVPVGINVPDSFLSVEAVIGSAFSDIISGAPQANGGRASAPQLDALGNVILNPVTGLPVPMDYWLRGMVGNDSINGADGNDTISGGVGNDTLFGGIGNDRFIFDSPLGATNVDRVLDFSKVAGNTDTVVLDRAVFATVNAGTVLTAAEFNSGGGTTTATAATHRIIFNTTNGDLFFDPDGTGAAAPVRFANAASSPLPGVAPVIPALTATDFTLVGVPPVAPPPPPAPVGTVINGTAANDNLIGTAGADVINGLAGNDTINGGAGNDSINGGDGNDILTGGAGADQFIFSTALNAATNVDTVTDFAQGTDLIVLNRTIFAAFGATATTVAANQFEAVRGTGATLGTTRVFYDRNNQGVFYDPDGNGPLAATRFATTAVRLANTNFSIV